MRVCGHRQAKRTLLFLSAGSAAACCLCWVIAVFAGLLLFCWVIAVLLGYCCFAGLLLLLLFRWAAAIAGFLLVLLGYC